MFSEIGLKPFLTVLALYPFTFDQIGLAILGYSLCSSTLLLANKMVIEYLPLPSVVSFIQIVSSAIAILVYKMLGGTVDNIEWPKLKAYSLYIVAFVAAIYANMQALSHSNVETVIVFRACSPIAVTIVEYFLMDRAWPSSRSTFSLLVVAIGAVCYCTADSEFALKGISAYYWVIAYFFLITFEMTYGKKLTSSVKMESIWGPVLYCNLLAALPMFLLGYVNGDYENIGEKLAEMPANGAMILLFSCVAGTLIGYVIPVVILIRFKLLISFPFYVGVVCHRYTGWLCRSMVSATTYTLVGVVNKFLTVLLNTFVWDKHSSPFGIFAVCVCLLAGNYD